MDGTTLRWSHGEATVVTTAAMLTACRFDLGGRDFHPFARAPWLGTVDDRSIVGHLRVLAGDFVGLPFGMGRPPTAETPQQWAELMRRPYPAGTIHGPAADRDWTVVAASPESVTLTLDYPSDSPVRRLERTIAGRPGAPALDFTLTVHARRAADISLGLHPDFRLPETSGRLRIDVYFAFGLTHPNQVSGGRQEFGDLASVPHKGADTDFRHIPASPQTDAVLYLAGVRGPVQATWLDENAAIELDWDRTQLPSLGLWHTDRGVAEPPWNNSFRAVGLEPMASAFDLETGISAGANPINRRGVATAIRIDPAAPLVVRHSIRAFVPDA